MELETNTNPIVETQTPAPVATAPVSTTPVSNTAMGKPTESTPIETATPPVWTPDFKFKAAGTDHEIPEMYRGLAKDQAALDEIKRLHEKAYGIDSLVQNRDSLKKQLADTAPKLQEYQTVTQNFAKLSHFVQNKDFDSFFAGIGVPEKEIISWIEQKIQLANATPEVRQQYDRNRQLSQTQYTQEQELNHYREQAQQYEQAQAFNTVTSEIANSAGDIAALYDSKMGEGAFADHVINKGIQLTNQLGKEPELGLVINLVKSELAKLGIVPQAAPPVSTGNPVLPKPTLPVIPAGGQSPIKSPVKSMKDLNDRRAAMGIT